MAERKYELLVQEKRADCNVKNNWLNERPRMKYLRQLKPGERIQNYDSKNWLFLRRGLDDFRDGLPPIGSFISKASNKGFDLAIRKDFVKIGELNQPAASKRLKQYQTYLSRYTPQKQQLLKYIESVEEGLLQHPLALYPHLESSVSPEIFETILDILDPQFSTPGLQDEDLNSLGSEEGTKNKFNLPSIAPSFKTEEDKHKVDQAMAYENVVRNLYKWLPQKESSKESKRNKEKEKSWPSSQSEEEHIRQVTRDFCEWVADLGGETNNIEESTITSLFASGYDTKPALSVPIHVVDLANVPHELRLSAMVPPPAPPEKVIYLPVSSSKKSTGEQSQAFTKFRYGAWYLNPNTWRKMDYYEPLEDPKLLKEYEMSEGKKKCRDLTEELAAMHASKAFDEFIAKKSTRKPEFLAEIALIQKENALKEKKRAESELLIKQKRQIPNQKEKNKTSY